MNKDKIFQAIKEEIKLFEVNQQVRDLITELEQKKNENKA